MKTINEYTELNLPDYSLSYLINGDDSGIDAEDKANADRFMAGFYEEASKVGGHVILDIKADDEGSFCHSPEFGLACNCVEGTILIVN